jgi:hypothetical protein
MPQAAAASLARVSGILRKLLRAGAHAARVAENVANERLIESEVAGYWLRLQAYDANSLGGFYPP